MPLSKKYLFCIFLWGGACECKLSVLSWDKTHFFKLHKQGTLKVLSRRHEAGMASQPLKGADSFTWTLIIHSRDSKGRNKVYLVFVQIQIFLYFFLKSTSLSHNFQLYCILHFHKHNNQWQALVFFGFTIDISKVYKLRCLSV